MQYLFSNQPSLGSYWEVSENGFYENIAIKFTTGAYQEDLQCGQMDITGDGIVNVVDIVALVNLILSDTVIDNIILCTYDLTGDNIINVILRMITPLIIRFLVTVS